ncbi:hypothetical protein RchiOBHm_Chr3g0475851 [Rosa chinensis]|uniref:DUF7138 domain-containing protein n=1 Tax=Rosa chinensis TaxID=74649 RepID=A0A2P6RCI5_ROSCH|nr:hypothetical protein RchiOBHm_Chr3g0475851 [Rosa chinensis]
MMEAIGGISFPVVFCDGESESEIGDVVIYPAMEFKRFQAVLSQKIGISPNQFSVFISSPESGRRIPVTSKINFSVISRETNCFFLVVLKRTKRERRRRNNQHHHLDESQYYNTPSSYYSPNKIKENPLENAVFLRRGAGINHHGGEAAALSGMGMPFAGRVEWENRVRELQIEKERYLMNMGLARASGFGLGQGGGGGDGGGGGVVVCEDCSRADEMGTEVGFHWCAYDPVVTFRFRSPAGPISRPTTR